MIIVVKSKMKASLYATDHISSREDFTSLVIII